MSFYPVSFKGATGVLHKCNGIKETTFSCVQKKKPFMLAWVTNMSTSPNLYIEFSTEPLASGKFCL